MKYFVVLLVGVNAMVAAQQARVSGQLGALAEGVGTLIKEIRELRTMKSIENPGGGGAGFGGGALGGGGMGGGGGGGSMQGMLAAATVAKALNAIHNAQSALNIGAGNVMGQTMAGGAGSPAFATGFRAGGAAGLGGVGLGGLAGLGGGIGFAGAGPLPGAPMPLPVPSPVVSFPGLNALTAAAGGGGLGGAAAGGAGGLAGGPLADSLSTSLSALGPKAASHFLNNLAKGMNKVTSSYLAALKKQQKESESNGGGKGGKGGKKGKSKASKRGTVILPASFGFKSAGKKSRVGMQRRVITPSDVIDSNEIIEVLLGEKRSKTKKVTPKAGTAKKSNGKKRMGANKRKISREEKSDQNDALLAQKAASVNFGNGLKPRK